MFKKVAIIGGAGAMGVWFSKFFLANKIEVIISDKNKVKARKVARQLKVKVAKNNIETIKNADLILISVLLQHFEEVVREISRHVEKDQIVIDITSLKEIPVKIMHKYFKKNLILGTHPLFGPSAEDTKQNFVLTPTNNKERAFAYKFKRWLAQRGFKVTIMSPRKHDEAMCLILGIPHFIGLVTGSFFSTLKLKELIKVSGPSFQKLLNLAKSVIFSDPAFYSELHFNMPKIAKIEENFKRKMEYWLKIIKNRDRKRFINEMLKIKKILGKFK
ncbi:MAG: prephenate dehydrogenase/arogenate dehydrogenase family protein [Candidatus Pacearchaeota archaeon]